ncbi:MAG: ROK family protein [Lachnospiraceae bacterium]|nr:ROK family protein [Lachnospiraceae bacterium]
MILGALETGGTKMVCAIGNEKGEVFEKFTCPTLNPGETLETIAEFFENKNIEALGIGSFGPVCLDKKNPKYGFVTSTPKPGWADTDVAGFFERRLKVPVGFDTDVNAAAIGEVTYGGCQDVDSMIYITIGTGIGVGVYIDGRLVHGMLHPEAGHILVKRHDKDDFEGGCPFHQSCLEGMAAGPAIEKRFGKRAETLYDNPFVWELESYYIAQALVDYCLCYSPRRIVLGGGVISKDGLIEMIRKDFTKLMSEYIQSDELREIDKYIVLSTLKGEQGIKGCLKIALDARV